MSALTSLSRAAPLGFERSRLRRGLSLEHVDPNEPADTLRLGSEFGIYLVLNRAAAGIGWSGPIFTRPFNNPHFRRVGV